MKPFNPHIIGIIGGKGRMGQWFARFFRTHGFKILISDKTTKLTNKQLVQQSDAVIFSVPIPAMEEVIKSVLKVVRKEQLLTDVCSLKEIPVRTMLQSKASVIGMHPMFGPFSKNMKCKPIIVCPARATRVHTQWLSKLFLEEKAFVHSMTAEEHDKTMAVVQMLTHLRNFVFAETLKKLMVDPNIFLELASPPSRIEFDCMGRILSQNLDIYATIATHNPYRTKVVAAYKQACEKLSAQVNTGNAQQFERSITSLAHHFKTVAPQCQRESDLLIEFLTTTLPHSLPPSHD